MRIFFPYILFSDSIFWIQRTAKTRFEPGTTVQGLERGGMSPEFNKDKFIRDPCQEYTTC